MRTFSTVTFATPPDISLPIEIPALHTKQVNDVSFTWNDPCSVNPKEEKF
jgi:hypothetical protein